MILQSEEEARAFCAERCEPRDMARLERFVRLLEEQNREQNLVSQKSLVSVWLRHVADSAQLLDHVPRETADWIDLGSGAGFPGLVLAIICPANTYKLVESRNLRIAWLKGVIIDLGLTSCDVLGMDVRQVPQMHAGVISARAFAPLDRLISLSARFSTKSTRWLLPKGRSASQEVARLPDRQRALFHVEPSVTDHEGGILVGNGKVESVK